MPGKAHVDQRCVQSDRRRSGHHGHHLAGHHLLLVDDGLALDNRLWLLVLRLDEALVVHGGCGFRPAVHTVAVERHELRELEARSLMAIADHVL